MRSAEGAGEEGTEGVGTKGAVALRGLIFEVEGFGDDFAGAFAHEALDLDIAVHREGLSGEAFTGFHFHAADEALELRNG